jgi:Fic family protein
MDNDLQIKIPDPKWGSTLANVILDLEKLRSKQLIGEVPPHIFFQLKEIFQLLETIGSARIEGNNTTLAEYVEKIIEGNVKLDEHQQEIGNLEEAIKFIEENTTEQTAISRVYISEIHKMITRGLVLPPEGEGSRNPGELRKVNVSIKKALHTPPDFAVLPDYYENFLDFINTKFPEQYQLLSVAIAHHRFSHIHPFDNGNGRMGRLLNYALLIKLGFRVKDGRIINPSCVFYSNRGKYYDMLSAADSLKDEDVLAWAEYFLIGLKNEVEKVDSLLGKKYVQNEILVPALSFALDRKIITDTEFAILKYLVLQDDMQMKSEELEAFGAETSVQKSRTMAKLKEKKMVRALTEGGRIYTIHFSNNYLLRGIIQALKEKGFVADFLNNEKHG